MNDWIAAAIAVAAGLILGTIASRLARRFVERQKSEAIKSVAGPIGSLVMATFTIIGLFTALGIVNPASRDQIPEDLVDYMPRMLGAAIVLIGANVVGSLLAESVRRAVEGSGAPSDLIAGAVKMTFLVAGATLAAGQLGFDTTIINLSAAALLFALAGGFVLLVGLGGRSVARQVAAGRSWRTMIDVGMFVRIGDDSGEIIEIHPVAVELDQNGRRIFIPHSRILDEGVEIVE